MKSFESEDKKNPFKKVLEVFEKVFEKVFDFHNFIFPTFESKVFFYFTVIILIVFQILISTLIEGNSLSNAFAILKPVFIILAIVIFYNIFIDILFCIVLLIEDKKAEEWCDERLKFLEELKNNHFEGVKCPYCGVSGSDKFKISGVYLICRECGRSTSDDVLVQE